MKKTLLAVAGIAAAMCASAQVADSVLMTINGKGITASEFLYIYEKNNQETSVDPKSIDEYLDLFTNFKLKVTEGEVQGIDTTAAFQKELAGYRAQATPKYMQDEAAVDSLVRLSYDHISRDRRAAHIAIQCPMNANDSITKDALEKINDARVRVTTGKMIKKGRKMIQQAPENFEDVAREVSNDPSVQERGGELGWITPFRYVYSLEEAVWNTPVGEVSEVFRSPFGFHIVIVEEERPHEEVHAAHIMKMVPRGNDSIAALKKAEIDSIAGIVTTDNFAEVARSLSDDKGSAMRGGDLGWFGRGMMVTAFEETAFATQPGTISAPFLSDFGWHIIYQKGTRSVLPIDSLYQLILKQVKRDERMKEADKSFIAKTRAEYQLSDTLTDAQVRAYADAHLEEKYADLRHLVKEYHDGMVLFEVSLREVWDKAGKDTVGLTAFFNQHKKDYTWDAPRYKGFVVYCKDKSTMKAAKAIINNSEPDSVESYLNHRLNLDSITYVKFNHGMWEKGQNPAVDKYGFKDKKAEYTPSEEFPYVFCVGKLLKAPEEYADERGKVTTDYQDYLDKEWLQALKEKYPVVINEAVWEQLKKESAPQQ